MTCLRNFAIALALTAAAFANPAIYVNCSRGASLQQAINFAAPGLTIVVTGACLGPITVTKDGLQIHGTNSATITASKADVVTVKGATAVELNGFTISGGNNGVVVENNSSVSLQGTTVTGNTLSGLVLLGASSATINQVVSSSNGLFGIDVEASSALVATGNSTVQNNAVFGIQVNNGSSLSLVSATVQVMGNTVGIQMGTNASGFVDGASTLVTNQNVTDGLTIVSGSHMVDFGGTIQSAFNGVHGISLNSKAGLDLDAGSQVAVVGNHQDGLHLERESSMTIFNNPNFSGNPGTTLVTSLNNQGNGINVQTNSGILVSNYAELSVQQNQVAGVALDDGSSLSFTQTIPVSGVNTFVSQNNLDLSLSFGSRLTLLSNDFYSSAHCDATVLTRGPNAPACPQ